MNQGSKKTIRTLCFAVLGMFTFSFALVPLYDVFCEVTGLNGKIELIVLKIIYDPKKQKPPIELIPIN